jgi:hypothetical protein
MHVNNAALPPGCTITATQMVGCNHPGRSNMPNEYAKVAAPQATRNCHIHEAGPVVTNSRLLARNGAKYFE